MVARGMGHPGGPVLIGVDGSPANNPAVGLAFEEAALRGVPLTALHAWTQPVSTGPGDMLPLVYDPTAVEAGEARLLAEALAGWQEKYPDVEVRRMLVHRNARTALIEATSQAQLAVVGTRGIGGLAGLLLGSVSQAVLHHAAGPVAVVPHRLGQPSRHCQKSCASRADASAAAAIIRRVLMVGPRWTRSGRRWGMKTSFRFRLLSTVVVLGLALTGAACG
jgi:nucleotide-binding universal stress UspA family protein